MRKIPTFLRLTDDNATVLANSGGAAGGVDVDKGDGGGNSAGISSTDVTPPNEPTLADTLAGMAARGEQLPGISDNDGLVTGDEQGGALNVTAVAAELARTHRRVKQTPSLKVPQPPPKPDTESDTDCALTVKTGKRRRSGDSDSAGKAEAKKRTSVSKAKRPRPDVEVVSSGSEEADPTPTSRHLSVHVSQIYKDWNGPLLHATRRSFQTLMMARDGFPLKSQAGHKHLNFKLVIRSAREIMPLKEFNMFNGQMDRAFRDTDKS